MTTHTKGKRPASSNTWILWVLMGACCIIATFIVYPATTALTGDAFMAVVATVVIAAILCIVVWQIWIQLDRFKGKRKDDELPVKSPKPLEADTVLSEDVSPVVPIPESGDSGLGPLEAEELRVRKLVSEIPYAVKEHVPFDIRTEDGLFILVMLRDAGFLDNEFWPVFGDQKTNVAFMAMCIASSLRLPEYGRWALFEKFWSTSNLGNLYNKSKKDGFRNANEIQRGVAGVFRNAIKINGNLDTSMLYHKGLPGLKV